jgi:hypothetical protein
MPHPGDSSVETLNDFRKKLRMHERKLHSANRIFLIAFTFSLLISAALMDSFRLHRLQIIAVAIPVIIVLVSYHAIHCKRLIQSYCLLCPECSKPLVGLAADVVIVSGRCGSCGNAIVQRYEETTHNGAM